VGLVRPSRNDQGHCGLQLVDRPNNGQTPGVRFVWESQGLGFDDRYRLRLHGQVLRRNDGTSEQLEPLVLPQDVPLHQPRPNRLRGGGFAGGDANLYRYVGNGPTNATDPSGLFEDPTDKETIDLPNVIGQVTGKRGIKIVPYSPLLGSLDRQLAEEYYSRAITGCFVLPRFSRNRIAIFRDDGFVSGGTATQRGDFLVDYAIAQGIPADGNFHNVKVPEWTNI